MYSIGIDLIEIKRIKNSLKQELFIKRLFGASEYEELKRMQFSPQSVAVNFCAKEAFLKVFGKGLGSVPLNEIELLRHESGQPYFKLSGKALELASINNLSFSVSATHTKNYASVVVLAYEEKK